jgi:hypothetical protein
MHDLTLAGKLWCMHVGCAARFAQKRNDAKKKAKKFRFEAKQGVNFACFALK